MKQLKVGSEKWLSSIARLCDESGQTVGTGFLVTENLVVTCTHVVEYADRTLSGEIRLFFLHSNQQLIASVEHAYRRSSNQEDVSFLRLITPLPSGVQPLLLGNSKNLRGTEISSHGFPENYPIKGIRGIGTIDGNTESESGFPLVQVSSSQMTSGFSGAPIINHMTGRAVGMVIEINCPDQYSRGRDTAFAVPTHTLWNICSELKPTGVCPYMGLSSFTERESTYFYGQENLVNELTEHLRRDPRFLAVVGSSGSGKSSVIRAGLFPKLIDSPPVGFSKESQFFRLRPGDAESPEKSLYVAIFKKLPRKNKDISFWKEIELFFAKKDKRCIVFIDQFEEVFSLFPKRHTDFIDGLSNLIRLSYKVTFILAIRSDFYSLLQDSGLGELLPEKQVNVKRMRRRSTLRAVIEKPAKQVELRLEQGLVELILTDLKNVGNPLPLLEFTLKQLWIREHQDNLLTRECYENIGRVTGAISQWATTVYEQLANEEERQIARKIFTRLISYGTSTRPDVRQTLEIGELLNITSAPHLCHSVIAKLADARLIVTSSSTVDIIHDALLIEWPLLKQWIEEKRPFLTWRESRLKPKIQEWKKLNRDRSSLLYESDLAAAVEFWDEHSSDLSQTEIDYITLSQNRAQDDKRKENKGLRRRIAASILSILIIAFMARWLLSAVGESNRQRINAEVAAHRLNVVSLVDSGRQLEALAEAVRMSLKIKRHRNLIDDDNEFRAISTFQEVLHEARELSIFGNNLGRIDDILLDDENNSVITLSSERNNIGSVITTWSLNGAKVRQENVPGIPISISPKQNIVAVAKKTKIAHRL